MILEEHLNLEAVKKFILLYLEKILKVKFKDTIAKDAGRTPAKKFKKGKELREKKMGGGMMGRRFGMKARNF